MPPQCRLTRSALAAIAALPRRRFAGTLFSLSTAVFQAGDGPRASVTVSKKVCPKAVLRNLLRRRCRAVLQELLPTVKKPVALMLSARHGAAQASYQEIRRDISALIAASVR